MTTQDPGNPIIWLEPGQAFPDVSGACGQETPTPGLLAAGQHLDTATLLRAYRAGIFPWFSQGEPVLWWSPDPRMVLMPEEFRVHRAFKKQLRWFMSSPGCEVRIDSAFALVIQACATGARPGQSGTWIVPAMRRAYTELHRMGLAHSVEAWIDGELAGGLYCVALGQAVFGESMFSRISGASRVALAALVAICRRHNIGMIDCQQNTAHLRLLGAREIARTEFCRHVLDAQAREPLTWKFDPVYWKHILP